MLLRGVCIDIWLERDGGGGERWCVCFPFLIILSYGCIYLFLICISIYRNDGYVHECK